MACQQLALVPDVEPRRFKPRMHDVRPGPRISDRQMAEELSLVWEPIAKGQKAASIFTLPWPEPMESERVVVEHNAHACGLCRRFVACVQPKRCTRAYKSPCSTCEDKVRASFRPGRYAVAR